MEGEQPHVGLLKGAKGGESAVKEAKWRCEALRDRIQTLSIQSSSPDWKSSLLTRLQSELSFLNRLLLTTHYPSSLCVNIGHLESVVHILQQPFITGVSRVCKHFPLPVSKELRPKVASGVKKPIYVDIACCLNGSPVWFIVSDRNPKYISWHGSPGDKGLGTRVRQVLDAAQSSEILRPSSVILFLANGLDDFVQKKLQDEFGAEDSGLMFPSFDCGFSQEPQDEWINVLARSYQAACVLKIDVNTPTNLFLTSGKKECEIKLPELSFPEEHIDIRLALSESLRSLVSGMKRCYQDIELSQQEDLADGHVQLVNFDTTALIAIVSGISNGGINWLLSTPESKLRSQFKCNHEFVIAQVHSEILNPIHLELSDAVSGKGGIVCQSVYAEFQELVSMCGGPKEKLRSNYVLQHLRVVPDCPSSRMMSLPTTRKMALKNKVVFGTGDYWHAPTLTANMSFVRAVSQTGLPLFTIGHRPRALIGE